MSIVTEKTPSENPRLASALQLARLGWRVFPCHTIIDGACTCPKQGECDRAGKHPLTPHGRNDATTDEATILRWWTEAAPANVGIATGEDCGLFMVGPDGDEGCRQLADLETRHGPLPSTPRARSGSGTGEHRYFALPPGVVVDNARNHRGLKIDVRGNGGLAIAPPSSHVSGGVYEWIISPWDVPLAAPPPWLVDWLRKDGDTKASSPAPAVSGKVVFTVESDRTPGVQERAIAYINACPPAVSGQGGHNRTFDVARAIVYGFDLGPDVGFGLLKQHYNPRCQPPWSDKELRHKCEDAHTNLFDKPRGWLLAEGDGPTRERENAKSRPGGSDTAFSRSRVGPNGEDTAFPRFRVGPDAEDIDSLPMPPPEPWPELDPQALYGLAGDVIRMVELETEADPVAILGQMLVAFGNAIGRKPYFLVEGKRHHPNLFVCLAGKSSHGRKGTSGDRVMQLMRLADADWCAKCVVSGLTSGEGVIWAVRDPIEKREPIKERGRVVGYQMVVTDEGVADKRLMVVESEFAQVLKVMQREGNSLSVVLRCAWDSGDLKTLTKNNPARATGAHVSIAAHITKQELTKHLKDVDLFNGFSNRFLWLCVRRARLLPDGGRGLDLSPLGTRLNYALATARNLGEMKRSEQARCLWHSVYPELTAERPGLYGAVTGRAEAQVLRLSMLYALFDGSPVIDEVHLRGALAFWRYAESSAKLIFGAEPEDPLVGMVLDKLRQAVGGLTRSQLRDAFNRNVPSPLLLAALAKLRDRGEAYAEREETGGRPAERWRLHDNAITRKVATAEAPSAAGPDLSALPRSGGEEVVRI
jgi:hypothetical protein